MSKTVKILLFLTFIALLLVFYLIMSSKIITVKPNEQNSGLSNELNLEPKPEKVDLAKLEIDYKEKIKPIFSEFEQMVNSIWAVSSSTAFSESDNDYNAGSLASSSLSKENEVSERISELKISLMSLTVPEQYKDMHLSLVLCFSKIKNSIENKSENDKTEGMALFRQAKNEYSRLIQ